MSSPTSRVDRGGNGSDRRNLAAGEINDDGKDTTVITTTRRIDRWHKLTQLQHDSSLTPAMADAAARRRYADETKPGTMKQTTREEPGAHPEHSGAENCTRRATEVWVDVHSGHGGANNDDGDAPVAALDKRVNQPSINHHDNMMKLKACQA